MTKTHSKCRLLPYVSASLMSRPHCVKGMLLKFIIHNSSAGICYVCEYHYVILQRSGNVSRTCHDNMLSANLIMTFREHSLFSGYTMDIFFPFQCVYADFPTRYGHGFSVLLFGYIAYFNRFMRFIYDMILRSLAVWGTQMTYFRPVHHKYRFELYRSIGWICFLFFKLTNIKEASCGSKANKRHKGNQLEIFSGQLRMNDKWNTKKNM